MSEQAGTVFDAEEVVKKQVNANGQVYLGRDLEGKTVRIAYEVIDEGTDRLQCSDCGTSVQDHVRNEAGDVYCWDCADISREEHL